MEEIILSAFFHTRSQANDFLIHLATISEDIYKTDFDLEKDLIKHFGIKKKDQFITLLRDNKVNIFANSDLETFINTIQDKIANLPILSLTIAFEPNEETLNVLSEWLFLNIHKEVLFDINIDTKLIAGAAISFNGKYADCTIKSRFDQIFKDVIANNPHQPIINGTAPQVDHQNDNQIIANK
jgi:F0F1-type ATP synthase delta subunit